MSATAHFSVKYDGPALQQHEMDVRELAPALLGLGELIEESNRELHPRGAKITVNVRGSFQTGSFRVDLSAVQTFAQQIQDILNAPGATAAANLSGVLALIGLAGPIAYRGLIGLIKFLKGRPPAEVKLQGDEAVYVVRAEEVVEEMTVDLGTHRLYQSVAVRRALLKTLRPLAKPGIDYFAAGSNGEAEQVVVKAELAWFERAAEIASVVSDVLSPGALLQIESAVFKEGNKWRFTDGAASFFAAIEDQEFLSRVEAGEERFGKGDVLVVDLRRTQTVGPEGLKLDHVIERVIQHRAPLQSRLPGT